MYAQNPMFSGVSPGRMAEARRFAQGGQMGRARQQFELGGGQWNPQVQGMIGQQDNIGQMIPGPGRPPMPPPGIDRWNPAPPVEVMPSGPGGWAGGGQGDPNRPVQAVMPPGWQSGGPPIPPGMGGGPGDMRAAVLRPGDKFWEPGMGGGMGGPPKWDAFPGFGGEMGRPPMPPPQFQGRPPAGGGFVHAGAMGGRPPAGPPGLRRMVQY